MVKTPSLLPGEEKSFGMYELQAKLGVSSAQGQPLPSKGLPDARRYPRNTKTYDREATADHIRRVAWPDLLNSLHVEGDAANVLERTAASTQRTALNLKTPSYLVAGLETRGVFL